MSGLESASGRITKLYYDGKFIAEVWYCFPSGVFKKIWVFKSPGLFLATQGKFITANSRRILLGSAAVLPRMLLTSRGIYITANSMRIRLRVQEAI